MGKGQAKILLPYPKEITKGIMFEREVLLGWRKLKTLCKMLKRSDVEYSVKFLPRLVLPKVYLLDAYRQDEIVKRKGITAIVKWDSRRKIK